MLLPYLLGPDERLESAAGGDVLDRASWSGFFHDDQVDLIILEDGGQVVVLGGGGEERGFTSVGVKKRSTWY